ncbi:MAG: DUF1868 domain-containing protein [Legionellaceae bacterium]|nr:DUF1868 domain-containing protein [Legionellaceae bacterium]
MKKFQPSQKVDQEGHYRPFQGVTVISSIDDTQGIWKAVHDGIRSCPLVMEYYSILPCDSYHMTVMDLYTKKFDGGECWEQFITEKTSFFQALNETIHDSNYTFNPQITMSRSHVTSIISLLVQLSEEQQSMIRDIAEKFDLTVKIPKHLHVTLGHLHKEISSETLMMIQHQVQSVLENTENLFNHPITLKAPQLCYFHDMTAFIPWNGDSNPFISSRSLGLWGRVESPETTPLNCDGLKPL